MLTKLLLEQLVAQNLDLTRFREITTRLFSWGIVIRDQDGVEQRLYDDMRRIENVLTEYFALAGFRLVHDTKNAFFRLYAPGAQIPGMTEDALEPSPSLRAKLSADFVASALALRFLYQQGLTDGGSRLTDAGEVLIRFDELAATQQTQIKRALPDTPTERKHLLGDLKRHRLIQFSSTFSMTDEDALIAIRPSILGIISEDALAAALDGEGIAEDDAEPQEVTQ